MKKRSSELWVTKSSAPVRPRTRAVVFGVVVAATITVGVAYASVPDATGVIHGCYSNAGTHALRVIDTAKTPNCPKNTTSLTWNQMGPRGATGSTGPAGTPGATGATGPSRAPGPAGPPGPARNLQQIATLHWYQANQSGTSFRTGDYSANMVFDGTNIWVVSANEGTVTEFQPSTGAVLATYTVWGGADRDRVRRDQSLGGH